MTIFIGRNITENSKVWLLNNGVDYVDQALIDIQLIEPDYISFKRLNKRTKHWIITSKWAALWLQFHHNKVGFQSADSIFCLSEKQAAIIRKFSDAVFVSKEKNIQSLSELVQQKKQNKLCLFLKGNRSLSVSGLEIIEVDVYQNTLLKPKEVNEFEVYLFFSPSGIDSFIQGGNLISENTSIVTIGETTAQKAKTVFENQIIVSDEQSELATIQKAVSVLKESVINLV